MSALASPDVTALPLRWRRRLREVWRSAGWPCQDVLEAELLAAGLLERRLDAQGRETLRLSDAGVRALAGAVDANRRALGAHEALVARVALEMRRAGRIVWRGLTLRAALDAPAEPAATAAPAPDALPALGAAPARAASRRWALTRPDVYSIRHTTREDAVEPVVHEIKVTRADLLSDLRHADKRAAYVALSSQCWYVLRAGIAEAAEIPPEFGVLVAPTPDAGAPSGAPDSAAAPLRLLRAAPRRPHRLPLATWMALARAAPDAEAEEAALVGQDRL
jgi:hypothetical protein